mmetsp:Transcript_56882/g.144238  ORF Transcript_56882/g.144238 Transcript_56882/m.144238 type:complete len:354 (+) Transcript_56882:64-1125(+)
MPGEADPLLHGRIRPTKHDPLLSVGGHRIEAASLGKELDSDGHHHVVMRSVVLSLVSWLVFTTMLIVIGHFYHKGPVVTLLFALQMVIAGALVTKLRRSEPWHPWIGRFFTFAAVVGTLVGVHVYYAHLIYAKRYTEMKIYSNVAPTQNPMQFADAGMVSFTRESVVNIAQSVGYQSPFLGAKVCVAPIVDSSMSAADPISFYAAGLDCCAWRSQFTCDDAGDAEAYSGLLYLPPQQLVTPAMEWAVDDQVLFEGLHDAVRLQAAVFGRTVSDQVRFVHWARDPRDARDGYRHAATNAFLVASVAFGLASVVAAVPVAMGRRRLAAMVESTSFSASARIARLRRRVNLGGSRV